MTNEHLFIHNKNRSSIMPKLNHEKPTAAGANLHDSGHHHHNHEGHNHSHHPTATKDNKGGLIFALIITGGIMFLEFFGGLLTNSLALLSDSGHMLSDTAALALSLVALGIALRPASAKQSYGFHRFEILAALFNGLSLFVIATLIIREALERFF